MEEVRGCVKTSVKQEVKREQIITLGPQNRIKMYSLISYFRSIRNKSKSKFDLSLLSLTNFKSGFCLLSILFNVCFKATSPLRSWTVTICIVVAYFVQKKNFYVKGIFWLFFIYLILIKFKHFLNRKNEIKHHTPH